MMTSGDLPPVVPDLSGRHDGGPRFARVDCRVLLHGQHINIEQGDVFHSSHPLVKARPELFTDAPAAAQPSKKAPARRRPAKKV